MERAGWPNFECLCKFLCSVCDVCCAQEGKLDLASSSCVEHGATAGDGC